MARPLRTQLVVPGIPHHIILRGNNRRRLFSYPRCYRRFLVELERASEVHACAVHGLALLTNHTHLTVTPPSQEALSRFVKRFAQRYAVHRNQERGATGKLFEQRFYCKPAQNELHLARLLPYIELNPERAGLVGHLSEHPWSTYWFHVGEPERAAISRSLWTPSEWWLSLGTDDAARAAAYRHVVDECRLAGTSWLSDRPRIALDSHESASARYTRRLTRPDGTRAAEATSAYGRLETGLYVSAQDACDLGDLADGE